MRIVIPDDYPPAYADYPDEVARLQAAGDVALYDTQAADREELVARLADADVAVAVRAYTVFDPALLTSLPNLRLIAIVGTGTDQVDLPAATEHGVLVCNAPGATTQSVAELTIALMFAAARRLPLTDRKVRAGTWYHEQGWELRGKTLGLVGLGLIGQQVARMGTALGMRVIAWESDPRSRPGRRLRRRACAVRRATRRGARAVLAPPGHRAHGQHHRGAGAGAATPRRAAREHGSRGVD